MPTVTNTSLEINGGAEFTNSTNLLLTIQATNAQAFIVSEHPNFIGARWQAWTGGESITVGHTLSIIEGLYGSESKRRIYVAFSCDITDVNKYFDGTNAFGSSANFNRFYDPSATVSETIVLDTVAPIPAGPLVGGEPAAFQINSGDASTANRIVTITSYMMTANQMRIQEVESGDVITAAWIPYVPNFTGFVLSDSSGPKRIIAQYRDLAGNVSSVYEQTIELLTVIADYGLLINDGGPYTYNRSLKVTLTITDPILLGNLASVWISEYENFAVRDEYAIPELPTVLNAPYTYTFRASPGEGLKTIYVRLIDSVSNSEERSASIFLDQTTPNINPNTVSEGRIVVLNPQTGGQATNNPTVIVGFQGVVSARSVIVANNPDFSGASWQPFNYAEGDTSIFFSHALDVSSGEGVKFVYVRFSDFSESGTLFDSIGNVTKTYVGDIYYDTTAPIIPIIAECGAGYFEFNGYEVDGYSRDGYFIRGYPRAISINNDAQFVLLEPITVNNVTRFYVHLTLTAVGASQMRLSTTLDANGEIPEGVSWIPYRSTYSYDVPPQAGVLSVYVEFRDLAGNVTEIYSDTIEIVDGAPVVPGSLGPFAILINGGDEKTNQNTVSLLLNAEYEPTLEMIISEFDTFASVVWEPYQTTKNYTFINTADGNKTVFVKFRITLDGGFIRESAIYSDSIIKDTKPPVLLDPPILINGGDTFTRTRLVNLLFNVENDPVEMQVINEIDYNPNQFNTIPWIPFQNQIAWLLSETNGEKRVYVRFRDDIQNTTVFASASILLNKDLPQAPVITTPIQGQTVNQRLINIQGTAEPGAVVSVTIKPIG